MNVSELIKVLNDIPREQQSLPVVTHYNGETRDVAGVTVYLAIDEFGRSHVMIDPEVIGGET
jgi:ABC-type histidine transport system ATPase subunit